MTESAAASPATDRRELLRKQIYQAAELLPAQGPITAFAFLNPLQALESIPFDEGLAKGYRLFGCQPYLSEERYRSEFGRGRIEAVDIIAELKQELGARGDEVIAGLSTRFELRQAMLLYPLRFGPTEELQWFIAETDALRHIRDEAPTAIRKLFLDETQHWAMRDLRNGHHRVDDPAHSAQQALLQNLFGDLPSRFGAAQIEAWNARTWEAFSLQSLWRVSRHGAHHPVDHDHPHPVARRHRDWLLKATGQDSDALVHEVMIRFCSAYADQGFADWALPNRELGFYQSFLRLFAAQGRSPGDWARPLIGEAQRLLQAQTEPLDCLLAELDELGVSAEEQPDFVAASLLALRGWAGLIWQMEVRGDRVPLPANPGAIVEFLAVRLLMERLAMRYLAETRLDLHVPLAELRSALQKRLAPAQGASVTQRAFLVFQLAQVLGWSVPRLFALSRTEWDQLIAEIEAFTGLERRKIFQRGFEHHYRQRALDAFSVQATQLASRVEKPRFQSVYCIDTREESFRRHLEEVAPQIETFGAAGFFSVAIYYRGAADAHYSTLCPIVVRPQHWVTDEVVLSFEEQHQQRARTRKALGTASHEVHRRSRTIAGGAVLTAGLGVLASVPLVARVLFPRLTARFRKLLRKFVEPPPVSRLHLERAEDPPGPEIEHVGFNPSERANIAERLLRDIGLTSNFARIVFFFGHGSSCLNNPHKACYDCGACTGGAGGPNARAVAAFLNETGVRSELQRRGINIPAETYFLGGLHNTGDDTLTYFDLDLLPGSHRADFAFASKSLNDACERNAHERCRRFQSAPLNITRAGAFKHVEERTEDLAQTRPEFGNCTNAMGFVGRRSRIRGMYLDRRCFLHSYDPTTDDLEATILGRILGAVVPVCSGINLLYYFSYVDSPGWGSGTKLPHNVTSLLGVMDGPASDLRSGLPWQGVEIHEPMRLLLVIESRPEAMRAIMSRSVVVSQILKNGWMQLALLDPDSNALLQYVNDEFVPYHPETKALPQAPTSIEWYRGWRDHLPFAQIQPAAREGVPS